MKKKDKIKKILKDYGEKREKTLKQEICEPLKKTAGGGILGIIKDKFKKYDKLYNYIVRYVSPVKTTKKYKNKLKNILFEYDENKVIINFGSGPKKLMMRDDIINIDMFNFNNVDIVSDSLSIIKDNSVDLIVSLAVLEHVPNANQMIEEMHRCLKSDGQILIYIPFLQPFHSAPNDFYRWTREGCTQLLKEFRVLENGVGAGPTSAFLWVIQEWISLLLSFNSKTLKDIIYLILMLISFPLKYLDALVEKHKCSDHLASAFYIHATK